MIHLFKWLFMRSQGGNNYNAQPGTCPSNVPLIARPPPALSRHELAARSRKPTRRLPRHRPPHPSVHPSQRPTLNNPPPYLQATSRARAPTRPSPTSSSASPAGATTTPPPPPPLATSTTSPPPPPPLPPPARGVAKGTRQPLSSKHRRHRPPAQTGASGQTSLLPQQHRSPWPGWGGAARCLPRRTRRSRPSQTAEEGPGRRHGGVCGWLPAPPVRWPGFWPASSWRGKGCNDVPQGVFEWGRVAPRAIIWCCFGGCYRVADSRGRAENTSHNTGSFAVRVGRLPRLV